MKSHMAVLFLIVLMLVGVIPSRLLNIHVGHEIGTVFMFVWFMVISSCPNWLIRPIRKLFKIN